MAKLVVDPTVPGGVLPATRDDDVAAIQDDDEERTYPAGSSSRWRLRRHVDAARSAQPGFGVVTVATGSGQTGARQGVILSSARVGQPAGRW